MWGERWDPSGIRASYFTDLMIPKPCFPSWGSMNITYIEQDKHHVMVREMVSAETDTCTTDVWCAAGLAHRIGGGGVWDHMNSKGFGRFDLPRFTRV